MNSSLNLFTEKLLQNDRRANSERSVRVEKLVDKSKRWDASIESQKQFMEKKHLADFNSDIERQRHC